MEFAQSSGRTVCFQAALPLTAQAGPGAVSVCPPRSACGARVPHPARRPRMSVSAPIPPAEAPPTTEGSPGEEWVTELTTAEQLDERLEELANETYVSAASDGSIHERPVLVLVEAYSKRCRACIGVRRIYQKVAEQNKGAVRCFKFDAFAVSKLAQRLGLRALPTFFLYKRVPVSNQAEDSDEVEMEWKRIDHFSATKREVLEQHILDNL